MAEQKLPSRKEDYNEWYNQVVLRAEMAELRAQLGDVQTKLADLAEQLYALKTALGV